MGLHPRREESINLELVSKNRESEIDPDWIKQCGCQEPVQVDQEEPKFGFVEPLKHEADPDRLEQNCEVIEARSEHQVHSFEW